jgi:AcrR family transcriptional regulator
VSYEPAPERAEPTRKLLLTAARKIFAEKGYDGTRVQDVAIRAGMTTGAIYANFRNKDELLVTAVNEGMEEYRQGLLAEQQPGASAAELLTAMGRSLRRHQGDPARLLMVEALASAHRSPEFALGIQHRVETMGANLASTLEQMRHDGELTDDIDIDTLVHYFQCVTYGYYLLESAGMGGPDKRSWAGVITRVVSSLGSSD